MIAPGPLLATVTQFVPAVREAGTAEQRARFLGAVAAGDMLGLARDRRARRLVRSRPRSPRRSSSTATHAVLAGEKRFVVEGDAVDELVVVARDPGRRATTACTRSSCPSRATRTRPCTRSTAAAGSRTSTSTACASNATACSATGTASSAAALRRAIEEATVATALEIVGTAQTIFDVTLEYAKQREQFGVPIGSFQAIKHKFADMIVVARTGPRHRLLRRAHDRRGRSAPHERDLGREGRGRRLPAPARQGRHPDPRRHRLHVGARHAPLREARQVAASRCSVRAAPHRARIADLLGV